MERMNQVRFFFTPPGEEGQLGSTGDELGMSNIHVIGNVYVPTHTSDNDLLELVLKMIAKNSCFCELAMSHSVTADIGLAKEFGGAGASRPTDSVILSKPSTQQGQQERAGGGWREQHAKLQGQLWRLWEAQPRRQP